MSLGQLVQAKIKEEEAKRIALEEVEKKKKKLMEKAKVHTIDESIKTIRLNHLFNYLIEKITDDINSGKTQLKYDPQQFTVVLVDAVQCNKSEYFDSIIDGDDYVIIRKWAESQGLQIKTKGSPYQQYFTFNVTVADSNLNLGAILDGNIKKSVKSPTITVTRYVIDSEIEVLKLRLAEDIKNGVLIKDKKYLFKESVPLTSTSDHIINLHKWATDNGIKIEGLKKSHYYSTLVLTVKPL